MAKLNLVETPEQADIIFDDLIDSGKTILSYNLDSSKDIVVLFVKP